VRRFLDRLYAASGALAALCLAAIAVVMLANAGMRTAGVLFRGADEITGWLGAAACFLALGHTFRHGELVRVGLWLDHLSPRGRWAFEIWALLITFCFSGYMLWAVTSFVYGNWQDKYVTQGLLVIPLWIPQVSLIAGILIFLVAVGDELVLVLRKQKPTYQVAEEERRAAGDFSETV